MEFFGVFRPNHERRSVVQLKWNQKNTACSTGSVWLIIRKMGNMVIDAVCYAICIWEHWIKFFLQSIFMVHFVSIVLGIRIKCVMINGSRFASQFSKELFAFLSMFAAAVQEDPARYSQLVSLRGAQRDEVKIQVRTSKNKSESQWFLKTE